MSKFKVGDLVKVISADDEERRKYVGVIGKIIKDTGPGYRWKLSTTGTKLFNDEELELVGKNEITISLKPLKITAVKSTELKIDSIDDLKAIENDEIKINEELYSKYVLGIWDKENPMIKKEGNKMIESMNLIDLYEKKISDKISKEANEKITTIRSKNSLENKMYEIIEKATNELNELYLSQLSDEQKEDLSKGKYINQDNFSLVMQEPIRLITDGSLMSNNLFDNEEIENIKKETDNKLNELHENVRIVKAHVGIAKTKEEVEEILTRYGIIDKKGKLVTE